MKLEYTNENLPMKKNQGIRDKFWKKVGSFYKSAASICKSVMSFLETATSYIITVNDNKCDMDKFQRQTNPFTHRISLSIYDKVKIFVSSIVLLPLRLIGVAICLVTSYSLASTGILSLSDEELKSKPMQGWRR